MASRAGHEREAVEASPPAGFDLLSLGAGYAGEFGPVYARPDGDRIKLGFRVGSRHVNPYGVCHGGALATFADAQVAAAKYRSGLPSGHTPTISLSIDFLGPAQLGAWVEAKTTLLKATRHLIFTQALITADGEPAARTHGVYRIGRGDQERTDAPEAGRMSIFAAGWTIPSSE